MAKFKSAARNVVLQDDDGVWAKFEDHAFETTDSKVSARLKALDPEHGITVAADKSAPTDA